MDEEVKTLAQSIRQHESGGDYNAKGKSGENGAYQFMPGTWKQWSKEVLGNENAPMTLDNQNAVAYVKIKQWKDSGLNPAQIAAKWNSGSESGWENKRGVNDQGVEYDVPAYVKKVTDLYQANKKGVLGTTKTDSMGEKLIDNSATQYAAEKVKDGTITNIGKKVYHAVADPLVDLAQSPVQLLAKTMGQKDPFRRAPLSQEESSYKTHAVDDAKGKAGSALETLLMVLPMLPKLAQARKLKGILKDPKILESVSTALPKGQSVETFLKMGKTEQANILGDLLMSAKKAGMAGDVSLLENAITALTTKKPGLISKALGLVTGGKVGLTDAMGMKEAYDMFKKYIK